MAQPRQWTVHPDETGEVNREHLARVMLDAAVIVATMGGAVVVTSRREEDPEVPGEFYTTHVLVRWISKGGHTVKAEGPREEAPATPEAEHADELEATVEETVEEPDPESIISSERALPDPESDEIPDDIPSGAEIIAAAERS